MAETLYSFQKLCDAERLTKEIQDSVIVTALDRITTVSSPATTNVYFKDVLSGGDETILNDLVTNHINTPLSDGTVKVVDIQGPKDESGAPVFVRRSQKAIYVFRRLLRISNGSKDMNVTGSLATPIHFEFAPQAGEEWEIERLLFAVDDVGLTDMSLFGGISSLTNGIQVSAKVGPNTYVVGTIQDNVDVQMMFDATMAGQSGVLDTADGMYGHLQFQEPIRLVGNANDYIRMSVRDDLRSINILRGMVLARRIL